MFLSRRCHKMIRYISSWIRNEPKVNPTMSTWQQVPTSSYESTMVEWKNISLLFLIQNSLINFFRPALVWWSYFDTHFSTCIKFSMFINLALTFYLQASFLTFHILETACANLFKFVLANYYFTICNSSCTFIVPCVWYCFIICIRKNFYQKLDRSFFILRCSYYITQVFPLLSFQSVKSVNVNDYRRCDKTLEISHMI